MSEQNSNTATTVEFRVPESVWGDKRGNEAFGLIRDYVRETMHLPETDTTTRVYYGITDQWNTPSSIVWNPVTKDWNGGFRTRAAAGIKRKNMAETKSGLGTGTKQQPDSTGTTGTRGSHGYKSTAEFNLENGTANICLGENGCFGFDAETRHMGIETTVLSVHTKKCIDFATNPRKFLESSGETVNGTLVQQGFAYGSYTSSKTDINDAAKEIVQSATMKMDFDVLANAVKILQNPVESLTNTGTGVKTEWLNKWLPIPVEPEKQPEQPTEQPANLQPGFVAGTVEELVPSNIPTNPVETTPEQPVQPEPDKTVKRSGKILR
jgi:hypothetical protein